MPVQDHVDKRTLSSRVSFEEGAWDRVRLKLILDARMPLGIRHFWFKICFPFLCFVRTALRPASFDLAFLLTVLRPSQFGIMMLHSFIFTRS